MSADCRIELIDFPRFRYDDNRGRAWTSCTESGILKLLAQTQRLVHEICVLWCLSDHLGFPWYDTWDQMHLDRLHFGRSICAEGDPPDVSETIP
jgi:hypothetical protein